MKTAPLMLSLLFAMPAFAQPAAPPPVPPAPEAAPALPPAPPADAPPPAPVETPPPPPAEQASAPALSEKVAELESKLEGMNETLQATTATANALAKIKVSGYIQGRYQWREDSKSGVDASGRVTNFDRFYVRRGRLKTVYAGENAEYLLQIDATGDGVVLKDAEATFVDTWSPMGFRLTMGQFKVPFGYEVLQSSGEREMPERARVIQALFPGERDRGARLTGRYEWFKVMAALVNGNFTTDTAVYNTFDNNRFSDVYLRVGGDFDFLTFGISGQYGEKLSTTPGTAASVSVTDANGDAMITSDEVTFKAATAPSTSRFGIWRFGADVQFYYDIAGVGGLALKGEAVIAKDTNKDFRGAAADSCRDLKSYGWIVTAVQNIGDHFGIAARLDQYDKNRDVAASCAAGIVTAAANDKITTLGVGLLGFVSGNLKASAVYEHLWRPDVLALGTAGLAPSAAVPTDILTLQLQAKF
jgi:hypothetical protein